MVYNRFSCSHCPDDPSSLQLDETCFENGLCFLHLKCKFCDRPWKAEVSMPTAEDFALAQQSPDLPRPRWRVVAVVPVTHAPIQLEPQL